MISFIRTFDEAISCKNADLDRLVQLTVFKDIEVEGTCNQPEHFAGRNVRDAIGSKIYAANHLRKKRSSFTDTSVYGFGG